VRIILWVVGGIVALNATFVAAVAIASAVDRHRRRKEVRSLEAWDLQQRPSIRPGSHAPTLYPRRERPSLRLIVSGPHSSHLDRPGERPRPSLNRSLARRFVQVAVVAVVCVGTAFASPEARQIVTSAWGTVARAVGLVSTVDPPSPPPTAPRRYQDSPQDFDRSQSPSHPDVASATTNIDPPSPPGAVTAVAASSTQIDLAWADVDTETGYRVERSPDGATDWVTVATTGQDVPAYSDTGLSPGATYYYRVFATNAGGDSPASDVASATTNID
jgi:hypothetical protein